MWVKICGITSLEDAQFAVSAGADAVGFVFANSPRRMSVESASTIAKRLPQAVEKIGVFVDATPEAMAEAIEFAGLTGVQLHGEGRIGIAQTLREKKRNIFRQLRVIHVLHYPVDAGATDVDAGSLRLVNRVRALREERAFDPAVDAVLVDTRIAGLQGGTGVAFDWEKAREIFLREAPHLKLIAAGGLNPENVQRAIHTLQPWGVDVSSGVEAAPGRKDPNLVEVFLFAAREAARGPGKPNTSVQR